RSGEGGGDGGALELVDLVLEAAAGGPLGASRFAGRVAGILAGRSRGRLLGGGPQGEVAALEVAAARAAQDCLDDRVAELPDVAGPAMGEQGGDRFLADAPDALAMDLRGLGGERKSE